MEGEKYIEIIKPLMSEKRFIHSLNVAKEAVKLADKYYADREKAYTAGVLHDIMKEIFKQCDTAAKEYGLEGNYMAGANIAGFLKVAEAMKAQGCV